MELYVIHCYDLTTKSDKSLSANAGKKLLGIQVDANNDLYILNNLGIHVLRHDGTLWETLVDKSICNMKSKSKEIKDFLLVKEEYNTFYVMYREYSSGRVIVKKYCYSESSDDHSQEVVTIYSLWESRQCFNRVLTMS